MKTWREIAWALAFGVVFGLIGAGLLLVVSRPPQGSPIILAPRPTPSPLLIHVAGAISEPGVYALPQGSRVNDAVSAAGGLLPEANAQSLNLAGLLTDSQRLYVPYRSHAEPAAGEGVDQGRVSPQPGLININTAGLAELEKLPGIGPALAGRIVAYREEFGPFPIIDDLVKVPGIGPAKFDGLKDLVSVDDMP